jgi:cytochrome c551/c552
MLRSGATLAIAAMAACACAPAAIASQYEFLAAPQIDLSLVYRLDKLTGDVIACKFAHNPGRTDVGPGAFGVTACYRGGDGATNQEPGEYGLIATRHEQEGGVFRVDYRTGGLSICYLYFQREKQGDREAIADQYVVCTPEWK